MWRWVLAALQGSAVALVLSLPAVSLATTALLGRFRVPRALLGAYALWSLGVDRATPRRGGRPSALLRNLFFWRMFRAYFPLVLVRKGYIDPRGKYVIVNHPHGIMSFGTWGHFISDHNAIPGVPFRVLTVSLNFMLPIWREFCLGMGLVDASPDSVDYLLRNGISVVVVVGGAHEALNARPATNDLTLARRLGFVRLALQHGASLVPVYSFGENAVYRQLVPNPPGSLVRRLQELLLRWFGYSLPLISGVGLLPLPRRITTVIGTPVPVPLRPHPTLAEVLEVHGRYVRALQALFDEYKDVAGDADEAALNVVDALSARDLQREERRLEKGLLLPPSDAQLLPISRL